MCYYASEKGHNFSLNMHQKSVSDRTCWGAYSAPPYLDIGVERRERGQVRGGTEKRGNGKEEKGRKESKGKGGREVGEGMEGEGSPHSDF